MQRRKLIKGLLAATPALWLKNYSIARTFPDVNDLKIEPVADGPFKFTWESLENCASF